MSKTVAQKMGLKAGMHAFFKNASASVRDSMMLPALSTRQALHGEFDYVHLLQSRRLKWSWTFRH